MCERAGDAAAPQPSDREALSPKEKELLPSDVGTGEIVPCHDGRRRYQREQPAAGRDGQCLPAAGWVEPEEIANAVAFLASDETRFITAEHLSIDAGAQHF